MRDILSIMEGYIQESEDRTKKFPGGEPFGLITEQLDLPLKAHKNSWEVVKSPERLRRTFSFDDLRQRALFVEYLMEIEEKTQHHAKIILEANDVTVEVYTHDIQRITELDKEYAKSCDDIYDDVILVRFPEYE